jgi:hypothetical protein
MGTAMLLTTAMHATGMAATVVSLHAKMTNTHVAATATIAKIQVHRLLVQTTTIILAPAAALLEMGSTAETPMAQILIACTIVTTEVTRSHQAAAMGVFKKHQASTTTAPQAAARATAQAMTPPARVCKAGLEMGTAMLLTTAMHVTGTAATVASPHVKMTNTHVAATTTTAKIQVHRLLVQTTTITTIIILAPAAAHLEMDSTVETPLPQI